VPLRLLLFFGDRQEQSKALIVPVKAKVPPACWLCGDRHRCEPILSARQ
jgi:hypothetical protein